MIDNKIKRKKRDKFTQPNQQNFKLNSCLHKVFVHHGNTSIMSFTYPKNTSINQYIQFGNTCSSYKNLDLNYEFS